MRLEIIIVTIIFIVFFGLNIISEKNLSEKRLENLQNSLNNSDANSSYIEGSDFIVNQITNSNLTNNEITNLSNKNKLLIEDELKRKNKVFLKLTNETN